MRPADEHADVEIDQTRSDVGSEGGSPGDVEMRRRRGPGAGTEATETWRPWNPHDDSGEPIARDETGRGRRSP